MDNQTLLPLLVCAAFGLLFYTYAAYPGLLWVLSRIGSATEEPCQDPVEWPTVTVIVSAYNEEWTIEERMKNLLSLNYPRDRIEILVGSDGSTDRTAEIVEKFRGQGIRLLAFERRRGKASVLNDLIAQARGTIVVPTDANTFFYPDAIRELAKALWKHRRPCTVVGRVDLHAPSATGNLDGVYWKYETWIKTLESRFGSVLGANGPIYAFFRARYRPLASEAIVDDFLIPMLMRLHFGDRIFFVPEARAWEKSPDRVSDEFRRRVRIGAGDFQALKWTWRLLLPWQGMVALGYFSHKVLRWLGPWFLLAGFGGNLLLLGDPLFKLIFLGQVSFYVLGSGAALLRRVPLVGDFAAAARYFLILNAGVFLGFARLTMGLARPTWATAPRKV